MQLALAVVGWLLIHTDSSNSFLQSFGFNVHPYANDCSNWCLGPDLSPDLQNHLSDCLLNLSISLACSLATGIKHVQSWPPNHPSATTTCILLMLFSISINGNSILLVARVKNLDSSPLSHPKPDCKLHGTPYTLYSPWRPLALCKAEPSLLLTPHAPARSLALSFTI